MYTNPGLMRGESIAINHANGATIAEPTPAWRDLINVAAFESVVFKVVQSQLGKRMYHCHILEHEDQGMMGVLEVVA